MIKKKLFSTMESLLKKGDKTSLFAVESILKVAIPFNAPHGFSLKKIDGEVAQIMIPNRKLNHNHLSGIHACAMATLGEFCAGMSLARHLGLSRYRLILAEINVKYERQGRTDLLGEARFTEAQANELTTRLQTEDKVIQPIETVITDRHGTRVAVVTSTWQLKSWDKVQLK